MGETPAAFPLAWPQGWPRTAPGRRRHANFGTKRTSGYGFTEVSVAVAMDRLEAELGRLAAVNPVLSSNLARRLDGRPRSDQRDPEDPGVAVYFTLGGRPTVLACDRWLRVADNIVALAKHIEALRGMDRWGVGNIEQAFTGYAALPAPLVPDDWRSALRNPATLEQAEASFRELIKRAHPDAGGSPAEAARLTAAIAAARRVMR